MRLVRRFHRLLLVAALAAIPGCDLVGGHGNVDVINGSGKDLLRVQLVYSSGAEEAGALGNGLTAHFTGIPVGSITVYGYDASPTAVASASGSLQADQTITLTLIGH